MIFNPSITHRTSAMQRLSLCCAYRLKTALALGRMCFARLRCITIVPCACWQHQAATDSMPTYVSNVAVRRRRLLQRNYHMCCRLCWAHQSQALTCYPALPLLAGFCHILACQLCVDAAGKLAIRRAAVGEQLAGCSVNQQRSRVDRQQQQQQRGACRTAAKVRLCAFGKQRHVCAAF